MQRRIILASTSPRRIEILASTGLHFEVVSPAYEEDMTLPLAPEELAKVLSLGKAQVVAHIHPDAIVIGADTFIAHNGAVLGKPHTKERARAMLKQLSGVTHQVITGLSIVCIESGQTLQVADVSSVTFRVITQQEIDAYIATGEPLDRAGAYAIQGGARQFVEHIDGDYASILGLPKERVLTILKNEFNIFMKGAL